MSWKLKAYVITLPQDQERYDGLIENAETYGQHLDIIRVEALYGKNFSEKQRARINDDPFLRYITTPSILGCGASHLRVLETFLYETSDPYCLIIEDDCRFIRDWREVAVRIKDSRILEEEEGVDAIIMGGMGVTAYKNLNQNWLNRFLFPIPTQTVREDLKDLLTPPSIWSGTSCYLLNRRGATAVLQQMKGKLYYHMDMCLHGLARQKHLRVLSMLEPCSTTVIQNSHNAVSFPYLLQMALNPLVGENNLLILEMSVLRLHQELTVSLYVFFWAFLMMLTPPSHQWIWFLISLFQYSKTQSPWDIFFMVQSLLCWKSSVLLDGFRILWLSLLLLFLVVFLFISLGLPWKNR